MKKWCFFSFFLILGLSSISQNFSESLVQLSKKEYLTNAQIGFYAVYTDSLKALGELNKEKTLLPASTQKLVTTSIALQKLGAEYQFKTEIYTTGKIKDSVLEGNIIIKGSGDPTLGSERFNQQNFLYDWSIKIKQAGIKKVTGKILTDISSHQNTPYHNWIWGDIANYYGASVGSINLFDNTQKLYFNTTSVGDTAQIILTDPHLDYVNYTSQVISSYISSDQAYVYGSPFDGNRIVLGKLPANRRDFQVKAALPVPEKALEQLFSTELKSNGIVVLNNVVSNNERSLLFSHKSPELRKIVYWTNQISMNLYAEALLLKLCPEKSRASIDEASLILVNLLQSHGINTNGINYVDGSGLSRSNGITPEQMVNVLLQIQTTDVYSDFYKSLPISGETGTLRNFGNSVAGKIHAKSGYIDRVRCYSGYLTTNKGREVAFSVMINNYTCTNTQIKKDIENLLIELIKQ